MFYQQKIKLDGERSHDIRYVTEYAIMRSDAVTK